MDSDGSGTEEEYVPRSGEESDGSDSCSTGVEEEEEEEGTAPASEEEGESIVTPAKKVYTHILMYVSLVTLTMCMCMMPAQVQLYSAISAQSVKYSALIHVNQLLRSPDKMTKAPSPRFLLLAV